MKYKTAIFDLDGTILESSSGDLSWLHQAVKDSLEEHNCEKKFSDNLINALAGLKGSERYREVCEIAGLEPEVFWVTVHEQRAVRKKEFIDNGGLKLCNGAKELLKDLKDENIRLGLVSNSPDTSVDAVIKYFDLQDAFHYYRGITTLEDLERRKPDPWHIEIAKAELKRTPFVYIGDSNVDVEAAENAGIDAINVRNTGNLVEIKSDIVDKK